MEKLQLIAFKKYLTPRPKVFHKGNAGSVLIVGGDKGYWGAPQLAGMAAMRVGAGLVRIAMPESAMHHPLYPELMCHGIQESRELEHLIAQSDVIVIGPGLGQSSMADTWLEIISKIEKPLVVDADALNLLAKKSLCHAQWILTPHPGEAARLLKTTVESIQQDRESAAKQIQKIFGGICVLKGAGSLIATCDTISICEAGNPGMATAGMGDVLSGVIGGLLAQQIPFEIAANLGVLLHALAGDLAAKKGERGMIASDLFIFLRELVNVTHA